MSNLPIFRAKKIDSEEYIIGDLFDGKYIIAKSELNRDISEALKHIREDILTKDCISTECKNEHHLLNKMLNKLLVNERLEHIYEIDPTTLSIHFPDMLDSQDNKIFASLQKDGKGGDIINCYLGKNQNIPTRDKQTVKYYKPYHFGLRSYDIDAYCKLERIGIQQ